MHTPLVFRPLAVAGFAALLSACSPLPTLNAGLSEIGIVESARDVQTSVTDGLVASRLRERLLARDPGLLVRVSVRVHRGRVLVVGRASESERDYVLEVAADTPGVVEIVDALTTLARTSPLDLPRDALIRGEIATRVIGEPGLNPLDFESAVMDGVVYVIGTAARSDLRDRLEDLLRSIPGVVNVALFVTVEENAS